jgi:hypothetical protein
MQESVPTDSNTIWRQNSLVVSANWSSELPEGVGLFSRICFSFPGREQHCGFAWRMCEELFSYEVFMDSSCIFQVRGKYAESCMFIDVRRIFLYAEVPSSVDPASV